MASYGYMRLDPDWHGGEGSDDYDNIRTFYKDRLTHTRVILEETFDKTNKDDRTQFNIIVKKLQVDIAKHEPVNNIKLNNLSHLSHDLKIASQRIAEILETGADVIVLAAGINTTGLAGQPNDATSDRGKLLAAFRAIATVLPGRMGAQLESETVLVDEGADGGGNGGL